ncbi:non-ribosomal peptide synthetase [Acrocarpospora catenulata]|uniref:non-ribosomal peptide synthetase n=1 Tax=Acrocarpospora catenulata TaxID=2836182 RepID=UPI001BD96456|nr:non-ribosomal peptide synthetase [Acrocarpospora catenulata]
MACVRISIPQSGIWFNEQLGTAGTTHHMPFGLRFTGPLDVPALRRACARLVARHPILRTAIQIADGLPHLTEGPPIPLSEPTTDPHQEVRRPFGPAAGSPVAFPESDSPQDVPRLFGPAPGAPVAFPESASDSRQEVRRPFDLAAGPLARFSLFGDGRLLVVAHHLVFDGQSTDVFVEDLAAFYRAEVEGGEPGLAPLGPVEAPEVEEARVGERLPAARAYWAERWFEPGEVVLPGLNRLEQEVQVGEAVEFRLPGAVLGDAAERLGVTRFEVVVASVHALLRRYGNERPVTALDLGVRPPEAAGWIGVYVNELPFASTPSPAIGFADFARQVRAGLRELYQVREVPLGRAVSGLRPGVSLAPISLTYRRRMAPPEFPGLETSVDWVIFNHTARNALRVHLVDGPDGLGVMFQFPPASIARADVERIADHWLAILHHVTKYPDTPLRDLPIETLPQLRDDTPYPAVTVPDLFQAQAARTPDAIAVTSGDTHLTYAELNALADRLAARLTDAGVRPGDLVALSAERSERMVAGVLACWKAQAAHLPLDPAYPADRLSYIAADSTARLLLTDQGTPVTGLPCIPLTDPDAGLPIGGGTDPGTWASIDRETGSGVEGSIGGEARSGAEARIDGRAGPRDRAYVIYTSGSTGRPKGVEIDHGALSNLILAMRDRLDAGEADVWLAVTSLSFDISGLELWLPLVTGGRVIVVGEAEAADGDALARLVARHGVTHLQATPSTWRLLLEAGFSFGGTALAGGEALPLPLAEWLRPRVGRLFNVYGPTETTIWSTIAEIPPALERITIGGPLANTQLLVLDDSLDPVPEGVPGELYIAGAGVARGYLNRQALTATRFSPNPYGPAGSRMYRTGDRVRLRGAELEFLGRTDDQIKLRGHRIELGEIESCLLAHAKEAAVAVWDDQLVAYTTSGSPELRRHLARTLPAYMVPSIFVDLPALPLTPNGKLDRAALPRPELPEPTGPTTDGSARAVLAEIWAEVFGLDNIDPDESLFDLGGHSLTIAQIAARIRDRLEVEVPFYAFFDTPSVNGIAAVVAERRSP